MSVGNQVEKPRFFIDLLQYQYEIGNVAVSARYWGADPLEQNPHIISLNPSRSYDMSSSTSSSTNFKVGFKHPISVPENSKMFVAILGHDFSSNITRGRVLEHQGDGYHDLGTSGDGNLGTATPSCTPLVNGGSGGVYWSPEYDGWSLLEFTPNITDSISAYHITVNAGVSGQTVSGKIGGFAIGFIYEPEFHADLAVTQSRIMDGVKNKNTKGGSTYSVINYTKPANWWTGSPFELTHPDNISSPTAFSNARLGRRSWDVGFSQLTDRFYTDGVPNGVFPANEMVNKYDGDIANGGYLNDQDIDATPNADGSIPSTGQFNYNINNDNSLYSTVYHHTLGGTLPFLFSPSQDNSPQNFAICRFDKPGFKVTQKSYKKFNIKMKINESW
tara:strand:- start:4539 stop:5702 length:1164 start_codon:yes stop_codon:yes gene_type:complete